MKEKTMSTTTTTTAAVNNQNEEMIPKLAFSEINLGRVIGTGGFSVVTEIRSIDLNNDDDVYDDDTDEHSSTLRKQFVRSLNNTNNNNTDKNKNMYYVLKTLRHDLSDEDMEKGITDLAIECQFLLEFNHKHIISMRGMSNSDPRKPRFFVILDKLPMTLDRKFNYWRHVITENSGIYIPCYGYCCSKEHALYENWKERLKYSADIISAIQYLHQQHIIYRDLKPDNIGFDSSGVLKIFDFGLAKKIDNSVEKTDDGKNFLLTGNTGSLRYMAPEIARDEPYNMTVDCYSFGVLFWQICSLTTPYAGYSQTKHAEKVVLRGQRPEPDRSWPLSWVRIMTSAWNPYPSCRPSSQVLYNQLTHVINEMSEEEGIVPTRASEIRAKKRRIKVKHKNKQVMDSDTRINTGTQTMTTTTMTSNSNKNGGGEAEMVKQHNAQVV